MFSEENQVEAEDAFKWTHQNTVLLLELYKKYRDQVGTLKLKNLKRMFEEIAKEMQRISKKQITPAHCENRWKVLERNYKKYIENLTKTGRGRKVFEYYEIMHEILGKKKNMNPVLLLSSDTINTLPEPSTSSADNTRDIIIDEIEVDDDAMEMKPSFSAGISNNEEEHLLITPKATTLKRKNSNVKTPTKPYENKRLKCNLLREIRNDRKEYYSKRLEIEKAKVDAKIRKNELLERKNQLIEQLIAKNNALSIL